MALKSHEELLVWQKSIDLAEEIYSLTKLLPKDEMYGLTSQMRRAVVSIPSNIAEGHSRKTTKEYTHFLYVARGSKAEIETQIKICERLGYVSIEQTASAKSLLGEVGKMLNTMIHKLAPSP
jgi:four helix bundle protein